MERENRKVTCHDQVNGRAWDQPSYSQALYLSWLLNTLSILLDLIIFLGPVVIQENTHTHTELMYMMDTYGIHSFFSESYPSKCPGIIII